MCEIERNLKRFDSPSELAAGAADFSVSKSRVAGKVFPRLAIFLRRRFRSKAASEESLSELSRQTAGINADGTRAGLVCPKHFVQSGRAGLPGYRRVLLPLHPAKRIYIWPPSSSTDIYICIYL